MDEKPSRHEKVERAADRIEGVIVTAFTAGFSYYAGKILTGMESISFPDVGIWLIFVSFTLIVAYIFIY